jgi:hypothetical protein
MSDRQCGKRVVLNAITVDLRAFQRVMENFRAAATASAKRGGQSQISGQVLGIAIAWFGWPDGFTGGEGPLQAWAGWLCGFRPVCWSATGV